MSTDDATGEANPLANEVTGGPAPDSENGPGDDTHELEIVDEADLVATHDDAYSALARAAIGHGLFLVGIVLMTREPDPWRLYYSSMFLVALVVVTAIAVKLVDKRNHSVRAQNNQPKPANVLSRLVRHLDVVAVCVLSAMGVVGDSGIQALGCLVASTVAMIRTAQVPYMSRYFYFAKGVAPVWLVIVAANIDRWAEASVLVGSTLAVAAIGSVFDQILGKRVFNAVSRDANEWRMCKSDIPQFRHAAVLASACRTSMLVYYVTRVHEYATPAWVCALAAVVVAFGLIGEHQFSGLDHTGIRRAIVWACAWSTGSAVLVVVMTLLHPSAVAYIVVVAAVDALVVFPVYGSAMRVVFDKDGQTVRTVYYERCTDILVLVFTVLATWLTGVPPHPFSAAMLVYLYQHAHGAFTDPSPDRRPNASQPASEQTGQEQDQDQDRHHAVSPHEFVTGDNDDELTDDEIVFDNRGGGGGGGGDN